MPKKRNIILTRNLHIEEEEKHENMEVGIGHFVYDLFVIVTFQSCAAGVANSLEANGETSGSAGVFVAILMLAGGIVSVATRNSEKKGGNIALIVLFGLAALVGFTGFGSFSDLAIWSGWCLINAAWAVAAMIKSK